MKANHSYYLMKIPPLDANNQIQPNNRILRVSYANTIAFKNKKNPQHSKKQTSIERGKRKMPKPPNSPIASGNQEEPISPYISPLQL